MITHYHPSMSAVKRIFRHDTTLLIEYNRPNTTDGSYLSVYMQLQNNTNNSINTKDQNLQKYR